MDKSGVCHFKELVNAFCRVDFYENLGLGTMFRCSVCSSWSGDAVQFTLTLDAGYIEGRVLPTPPLFHSSRASLRLGEQGSDQDRRGMRIL